MEGTITVDRKTILLMACRDMLIKCRDAHYVIDPMVTTVFYDDAECDGSCLLADIEIELEEQKGLEGKYEHS